MGNEQKTIVKLLIAVIIFLLIQDTPKAIYYICAIFYFTILAQYLLYNNKKLFYIKYTLYRFDKIKIAFKKYCPIHVKLF